MNIMINISKKNDRIRKVKNIDNNINEEINK